MAQPTPASFTVATGQPLRFGVTAAPPPPPPPPPAPALTLSAPTSGTVGVTATGLVSNTGTSSTAWSIDVAPAGLSVSPASGTLAGGQSVPISLLASSVASFLLTLVNGSGGTVSGSPRSFAAAAAPTPPPPPPPPAPGSVFASVKLTPSATGTLPYNASLVPLRGQVPAGYTVVSPDDSTMSASVVSTWDDGSAALMVLAGRAAVVSGTPRTLRVQAQQTALVDIGAPSVTVPADFFGMHVVGMTYDAAAGPGYDTLRTHDALQWRTAHTAAGTFDWTLHDAVINAAHAAGRSVCYVLYGTPTWAARSALASVPDAYGSLGGASPPSSNATAAAFVTALLARYNGSTRKIQRLEFWNKRNSAGTGFWLGSVLDAVQMDVAVRAAARAQDPGIELCSAGFYNEQDLDDYLKQLDPASGLKGVQLCDSVAVHPYAMWPHGTYSFIDGSMAGPTIARARASITAAGGNAATIKVRVSEWGVAGSPARAAPFLKWPVADRRARVGRMWLMAAIHGVASFDTYGIGTSLAGDYLADTAGVMAEAARFRAAIPGKVLTQPRINPLTGELRVLANGTEYVA